MARQPVAWHLNYDIPNNQHSVASFTLLGPTDLFTFRRLIEKFTFINATILYKALQGSFFIVYIIIIIIIIIGGGNGGSLVC